MKMVNLLSILLERKLLVLIGFVIFSFSIAIIITLIGKKPRVKEEKKDLSYEEKLKKIIKIKEPEEKLARLSDISKEFFAREFRLHGEFYDLEIELENKNQLVFSQFCKKMLEAFYSEEKVSMAKADFLVITFIQEVIRYRKHQEKAEKPKKKSFSLLNIFENKEKPKTHYHPQVQEKHKEEERHKKEHKAEAIKEIKKPVVKEAIKEIKKPGINEKKVKIIHEGHDDENKKSFFVHHHHFYHAKNNFNKTKSGIKKIHSSLQGSKDSALKENIMANELSQGAEDMKAQIQEIYKKLLTKI